MTVQDKQKPPLHPEAPVLLDVDGALKRLGGKAWIYVRILQQFASDCCHFSETMVRCLEKQDRKGAERLAHKIKGAAGQTGAIALYEMAPELQRIVATQPTDIAREKLAGFEKNIEKTVAAVNEFLVSQGIQADYAPQPSSEPEKIPRADLLEGIRQHASMGRFSRIERMIDDLESRDRDYATFCQAIRNHIRKYDEAAIAAYINRWT